jgi:hypothetical protein
MSWHVVMTSSPTVNDLAAALSQAQGEFPIVEKNRTAKIRDWGRDDAHAYREYKYADLADVLRGVLPILSKYKLAVLQPTYVEAGMVFIRTRLLHVSGQWIECEYPVCATHIDQQRMGSALTYAKRYALCALLGVAADEDNDGATIATGGAPETSRAAVGNSRNRGPREPRARSAPVVRPTTGGNILPPLVSKPVLSRPQRKSRGKPRAMPATVPPLNGDEAGTPNGHSQSDRG